MGPFCAPIPGTRRSPSIASLRPPRAILGMRSTEAEIRTRRHFSLGPIALSVTLLAGHLLLAAPAQAAPCSPTITTDGAATVVSFTTVGTCTWTVPADISMLDAVLIVGGGGGGGFDQGGGGGAGGLVDRTNVAVTPGGNLTILVGAGGAGAVNYAPTSGTNSGGNSSLDGVVALGGGYGGSGSVNGASGGSGGGAGYAAGAARSGGSALQPPSSAGGSGFAGGDSPNYGYLVDTGGGGGGAAGQGVSSYRTLAGDFGGPGGAGVLRTITGTSLYYAGGGGGASAADQAMGGSGVGGNGGTTGASSTPNLSPTAGAANTGSGGGGGKNGGAGAAGAAGIVILRYGGPSPAARAEEAPPSWFQSVGRTRQEDPCEPGWAPSWAEWMNDGRGGWVCNREIYWDPTTGGWLSRS